VFPADQTQLPRDVEHLVSGAAIKGRSNPSGL
jgi:hypothetical protein